MPPITMPATAEPMHALMIAPVPWSTPVLANDEASEGCAGGGEGGEGGEGGDMCRAPQSAQSVPRAQSGWDP